MKNLLLALSLLCFISLCSAQNSIYPDAPYADLAFVDSRGDNIFALSTCRSAMYSKDGGANWTYIDVPDKYYRDMKIVPSSNGDLAIFIVDAEMQAWNFDTEELSTIDISTIADAGKMRALEVADDVLYVIAREKIYYSELGTVDWQFLTDVDITDSNAIITSHINSSHLYLGTLEGHVFSVALSGGAYELLYQFDNRVSAFYLFDDGIGYATIQLSVKPKKSSDGGATWTNMDEFGENAKLYAYDSDKMLTANTNRFYVSTDGGASTTYVPLFDNNDIGLIAHASFTANGELFLVGNSSTIIKSNDVGLTYENLNEYNRSDLGTISFKGNKGVAAGAQALLLSEDGGDSWSSFDVSQIVAADGYINSAAILADDEVIVGHDEGYAILKNGNLQSEGTTSLNTILSLPESGILLAVTQDGSDRHVIKSTDNGLTWATKFTTQEYLSKIRVTENGKIYFPKLDGYAYSEDDGENWSVVTNTIEGLVRDMHLLDDDTSIFSIDGKVYESPDGGITMTEAGGGYALNNLHFLNSEHYIYTTLASNNTAIRQKKASNSNSSIVNTSCAAASGSFLQGDVLWLSFRGGHINKYQITVDPPNSTKHITASPLAIQPNPSALGSELQFSDQLAKAGHLQIFDQLGQVVLDDANFSAASLELSPSRFAAGTYFIALQYEGQHYRAKLVIVDPGF